MTPLDSLGDETHFYVSPNGTTPDQAQVVIAWRQGGIVAVLYGKGADVDELRTSPPSGPHGRRRHNADYHRDDGNDVDRLRPRAPAPPAAASPGGS